jgi:hypothetical protein
VRLLGRLPWLGLARRLRLGWLGRLPWLGWLRLGRLGLPRLVVIPA